jgi:NAD(P)-dependent dehydrogenase (short-subunit alcohol dehydrogenase family)
MQLTHSIHLLCSPTLFMKTLQKVAIVTGASSGIGKETVRALLGQQYYVFAAARRLEAMRDLEREGAQLVYLDLLDAQSITACVTGVLARAGRIDVLVNNAGYGSYGALEDVPLEEARRQFEVNLFGLAQLIKEVLPSMREQQAGRIINVGSIGGKVWSWLGTWYQATKFALEGFSDCLRNELRPFGIAVVLIEPGSIKTEWATIAVAHLRQVSAKGPYRQMAEKAARFYLDTDAKRGADPRVVARAILVAATAAKPKARYVAPAGAKAAVFLRWLLPDAAFDSLWGRFFGIPARAGEPAGQHPASAAAPRPVVR